MTEKTVFKGNYFYTPNYDKLAYLKDTLIITNSDGMIEEVIEPDNEKYAGVLEEATKAETLVDFKDKYVFPGFVDLHVHAPQWPQEGVALDEPLDVWLNERAFPLEAKYKDMDFAHKVYSSLVHETLSNGTTTVLYFGSVYKESTLELARLCGEQGQRGLVGKVVMDLKEANPDYYRDSSTEQALADTEDFILKVKEISPQYKQGIYPVVTPRFVPSCTKEALEGLGELARKYNAHVQSHCSESQWEDGHVFDRFGKRDTDVLNDAGLFSKKSVMAHCSMLNDEDAETFAKTKTSVAHCPFSNAFFANGALPVKRLKEQGLNIGLGTDISAGFTPSIYVNLRQAVVTSRMLEDGVDTRVDFEKRGVANSRISLINAFYLATRGGGKALDLPLGKFEPGYICDMQVIDPNVATNEIPNFDLFLEPEDVFAKLVYRLNKTNIKNVWVQGQLVINQ